MPNLSSQVAPLYRLTRQDISWKWGKNEEAAFKAAKDLLSADTLLVHYNPKLPILLECDASPRGIGAVLSHRLSDGTEQPIAYASRRLTDAEANYSQIDREGLALVYGVTKFHQYLFGRHFNLVTDHKPLTYLFGPHATIPTQASPRVVGSYIICL